MIVLGLNAYHGDSSACLMRDGRLVAAAEEERFRRIKHWAGFPSEAIRYCLAECGVSLVDVDHIAINQDSRSNVWRKVAYSITHKPKLGLIAERMKKRKKRMRISDELAAAFPDQEFRGQTHAIDHHRAHLGSAFLVSPFEDAAVASVDGFGDFASAAWGFGRGGEITLDESVYFPHSLGILYQAMTQYLGFHQYGDEYKVMGLAPYGEPRYLKQVRELVHLREDGTFRLDLRYFRHHVEKIDYEWDTGEPRVGMLYSDALSDLLGPARDKNAELTEHHKAIARSVQAVYEEAFFNLLNALHARHGNSRLALAGGCAMNSVANGKVYLRTPFKKLYVQSAAGDAGGAIGAAFVLWHDLNRRGTPRDFVMDHAYWGPGFSNEELGSVLAQKRDALAAAGCTVDDVQDEQLLCDRVASAISQGLVVGWLQGRMEWGPRALGNRSIVCDPRRADMKDILNRKIKRRESFRPFAPSILREAVPDWFEIDDDVPFMMQVYPIRQEKRVQIPAVTHVDGSGRLQTVYKGTNPRYYKLIEAFRKITGVPLILNTSFNENEPVVCRPEEALDCFLRTKMDVLALGNWIVSRVPR